MHNVVHCVHYCVQPILFHIGVVNGPWRNAQLPVYKSVCVYITCKERRWAIFITPCIVVTSSLHTDDRELTIPSQDRSAVNPKTSSNISEFVAIFFASSRPYQLDLLICIVNVVEQPPILLWAAPVAPNPCHSALRAAKFVWYRIVGGHLQTCMPQRCDDSVFCCFEAAT